jgi:hypothetical protein
MRQRRTVSSGHIRLATIAILLLPTLAVPQDVTGPALKAAFIYNLAKFTEWPDLAAAPQPFTMCVLGDPAVGDALERTVKDRLVAGNGVNVVRLTSVASHRTTCHILYVSGISSEQASMVIAALGNAPVLTISDIDGFADLGGIAQFFYEHGQLRFSIDTDAADRAHLQISAKVLKLAIRK